MSIIEFNKIIAVAIMATFMFLGLILSIVYVIVYLPVTLCNIVKYIIAKCKYRHYERSLYHRYGKFYVPRIYTMRMVDGKLKIGCRTKTIFGWIIFFSVFSQETFSTSRSHPKFLRIKKEFYNNIKTIK